MDFRNIIQKHNGPLVTIGVTSYNYAQYIREALHSLLTQTYQHIELIIIDDCSADNCPEIITNWIAQNNLHCQYIEHKKNLGITKTLNEIVKLATGKYIVLFATDDIMLPERIEQQVKVLEAASPDVGMCYANALMINEDAKMLGAFSEDIKIAEGNILEHYITRKLAFATPVAMIRMDVYKEIGLYNEKLLIEDYDFWIRLLSVYGAVYCSYPCMLYRLKKESAIWNRWMDNNKERYYHDRIIANLQGMKFIKEKHLHKYVKQKISQYLKALAAHNSVYFNQTVFILLKHFYFNIPLKAVFIKLRASIKNAG